MAADHFTMISNDAARDARLSFRARGVLTFILSHREGWEVNSTDIAGEGKEGRDAVRVALNELERHGYLTRQKYRGEGGQWAQSATVTDVPNRLDTGVPGPENPAPVNPAPVVQALNRRPSQKTKTSDSQISAAVVAIEEAVATFGPEAREHIPTGLALEVFDSLGYQKLRRLTQFDFRLVCKGRAREISARGAA
jgi:hypothetical protein